MCYDSSYIYDREKPLKKVDTLFRLPHRHIASSQWRECSLKEEMCCISVNDALLTVLKMVHPVEARIL